MLLVSPWDASFENTAKSNDAYIQNNCKTFEYFFEH